MIEREMGPRLRKMMTQFPIVSLTGPRQSGKSTLAQYVLPSYRYVTLENPNNREFAAEDPKGFLATYNRQVIIDEAQRVPHLFNYLQEHIDRADEPGQYLLSGSQDFLLLESITQSLAGRTALLNLLPLSRAELEQVGKAPASVDSWLFEGAFPRLHRYRIEPTDFFPSYIQTYLERDARLQVNAGSLNAFQRFLRLCAGRVGGLLDVGNLAIETGVNVATVKRWLSILEASYLIILVQPYFKNYNKRLVKRPKLYFCDTGLVCSLLGLRSAGDVAVSPLRGALFENMVLVEYLKRRCAVEARPDVWFWQETSTNEVDFIIGSGKNLQAVEVKSGATFSSKWFRQMKVFAELAGVDAGRRMIVYAGEGELVTSQGRIIPWREW